MKILAALLLVSCAPTHNAIIRRQAEARLTNCMLVTGCRETHACINESLAWCQAQGLEATCGTDGLMTSRLRCDPFQRMSDRQKPYDDRRGH